MNDGCVFTTTSCFCILKYMKAVFFDVDPWARKEIAEAFPKAEFVTDRLTEENVADYRDAEIISIFHTSTLSGKVLCQLPHLKFIATRSTGFNHIELPYCAAKNIIISNVPSYGRRTVAEHTFGLILMLTRHLYEAVDRVKHDGKYNIIGLVGEDLFGKTIGIIGLGEIGTSVLKIAKGFGMEVLVHTRTQDPAIAQELGFVYVTLEELLKKSHIVTLHLPLTDQTKHTIDTKNIHHFRRGAYLINTARGALIDTDAILIGLEEGILAGVGLDVLESEYELQEEADLLSGHIRAKINYKDLVLDHVLMHHDKVLITPHNAFNSIEARRRILETTFENIKNFLDGHPENIVSAN